MLQVGKQAACKDREPILLCNRLLFNETQQWKQPETNRTLLREVNQDSARIEYLFQLLASRKPSEVERKALFSLLDNAEIVFQNLRISKLTGFSWSGIHRSIIKAR